MKPKQPLLTWIDGLPDTSSPLTLDVIRQDSHAYLLPEYAMDDERVEVLREFHETIFENELMGWWTDATAHPTPRTFEMFLEWFEVEFHSVVVDLLDEPIEHEPD